MLFFFIQALRRNRIMIKDRLRSYLGVEKLEARVEDNTSRLRELEPVTVDMTDRQRQVLEVFLNVDSEWVDVSMIAQELNTSRNNAGSIMSDLKKKIEFDIRTVNNGKKLYQLPEEEEKKIFNRP